ARHHVWMRAVLWHGGQSTLNCVVDDHRDFVAAGACGREPGIDDRALRGDDPDRAVAAAVRRDVGIAGRLKGHVNTRVRITQDAVEWAFALWRAPCEVDLDLVSSDAQGHADFPGTLIQTVIVQVVRRRVIAVWPRGDRASHTPLGSVEN